MVKRECCQQGYGNFQIVEHVDGWDSNNSFEKYDDAERIAHQWIDNNKHYNDWYVEIIHNCDGKVMFEMASGMHVQKGGK